MNRPIAILGCGPAGLLAAHACQLEEQEFVVYSKPEPSVIGGAQFLHREIPWLTNPEPDGYITFKHWGDEEGYATKVYGDPAAPCSWDAYPDGETPAWNMQAVYNELWSRYSKFIVGIDLKPEDIPPIMETSRMVWSTVPLKAIAPPSDHVSWQFQQVWIVPEMAEPKLNQVVYNGLENIGWYRECNLFGQAFREYSYDPGDTYPAARKILKPLTTNCDAWPGVLRMGRYGKWQRGVLIHHAFEEAIRALHVLQQ